MMRQQCASVLSRTDRWLVVVSLTILASSSSVNAFYLPAADYYCHPEDVCPSWCPAEAECAETTDAGSHSLLEKWFLYWAASLEVLARGFAFGFGVRMLKYIFWDAANSNRPSETSSDVGPTEEADKLLRNLPAQIKISAMAGLSMASVMFGMSLFLPTDWRVNWFDYYDITD